MERLRLAEHFLQEAVYQSRAKQAAGAALAQAASQAKGQCGLGAEAAVELDLSARGRELFDELWPSGLQAAVLARVRAVLQEWVERQDALDRDRNHFLKAFRQRHGFERNAYAPETLAQFESGLAAVNAQVEAERQAAAQRLLAG